jgi:hypothetical protein
LIRQILYTNFHHQNTSTASSVRQTGIGIGIGSLILILTLTIIKMKLLEIQAAIGAVMLLLSAPCDAKHSHALQHLDVVHKRHTHHRKLHASQRAEGIRAGLVKRGTCKFPTDKGLVSVTPDKMNAGWALSPDQACTAGTWCPFACPPGEVMNQWNPLVTSYVYPGSMVSLPPAFCCTCSLVLTRPFRSKEVFIVMRMATSTTHSLERHCVLQEPELWRLRMSAARTSLSARPSYLETKPC